MHWPSQSTEMSSAISGQDSYPKQDDCDQRDSREEEFRASVVTYSNASPVLKFAKHIFDLWRALYRVLSCGIIYFRDFRDEMHGSIFIPFNPLRNLSASYPRSASSHLAFGKEDSRARAPM
jgi:hypothetical protein